MATSTEPTAGGLLATESLEPIHWAAIGLALATGVFHVYAGIVEGRIPVSLAGVGFLGAVVLFLIDYRRRLLYLVGVVYTAVQFPLWYVVKAGEFTTLGYVDKAMQAVLIGVLLVLYWRSRTSAAGAEANAT